MSETYTIRQMMELTGLSEYTLRGWEGRYKAFRPSRGDSGRREYKKQDVEKAMLLRELVKRGNKISKIAGLSNKKLNEFFVANEAHRQLTLVDSNTNEVQYILDLMALQKWNELDSAFRAVKAKDVSILLKDFFLPLLSGLSENFEAGFVSISQEHILSAFLKEKIYSTLQELTSEKPLKSKNQSFRFVLAAPEGDYHEIGLLLAHLLIKYYGFQSLLLGSHTPCIDVAESALRFDASHVLIVSTVNKRSGSKSEPLKYVNQLQTQIGSRMQLLFAGPQASKYLGETTNLKIVNDFQSLENYLQSMEE